MQQIIKLKPGPQVPPVFTGLSNITYVADGGVVEFTSELKFGNAKSIYFDAADANSSFKFSGTGRQVLNLAAGNNIDILFLCKFDVGSGADMVVNGTDKYDGTNFVIYNGTPGSALVYGLYFKDLRSHGKTRPVYGTYEASAKYRNYLIGISIENYTCIVDPLNDPIKVFGNSIFGFRAGYDRTGKPTGKWSIQGPTTISGGDSGIIYITTGNGKINNLWSDKWQGYDVRMWLAVLGGIPDFDQSAGIYNSTKTSGTMYGLIDIRIQGDLLASNAPISLKGCDYEVAHIDSGDNMHDSGYIANAVVFGTFTDDLGNKFVLTVRDSFAWNAYNNPNGMANGSSLLKDNSSGQTKLVLKNNIDLAPGVPLPAGYLVDKTSLVPVAGGHLSGKASDGTDIGAVQHVVIPPPVVTPPTIKQRTASGIVLDLVTNKKTITYDDGSTSTL